MAILLFADWVAGWLSGMLYHQATTADVELKFYA